MSEEQLYIVGTLKAIFFQNPSNFYKVLLIKVSETNSDYLEQEIVVTGSFGDMQEDEDYRFFGHFVDHPRYGKQFLVESYEQAHPTSANGLINYLSSEKFPGIGKKTAEKIIEVLGEDAIDQSSEFEREETKSHRGDNSAKSWHGADYCWVKSLWFRQPAFVCDFPNLSK
jgi:exodeoxyribonuclease V alpha subunit